MKLEIRPYRHDESFTFVFFCVNTNTGEKLIFEDDCNSDLEVNILPNNETTRNLYGEN